MSWDDDATDRELREAALFQLNKAVVALDKHGGYGAKTALISVEAASAILLAANDRRERLKRRLLDPESVRLAPLRRSIPQEPSGGE